MGGSGFVRGIGTETGSYGGKVGGERKLGREAPREKGEREKGVGLSILTNLGLPGLIAYTEDDYVRIATELAGDIPRLTRLRATLRPKMEKSVLMDGAHFTRQIEAAYLAMWQQWCSENEQKPDAV